MLGTYIWRAEESSEFSPGSDSEEECKRSGFLE